MASTSLPAHPAHHPEYTVPKEVRERALRGLSLFREDPEGVEPLGHGTYKVGPYTVDLDVFSEEPVERCSCPDYRRHKAPCKHIYRATIARAKHLAESAKLRRRAPRRAAAEIERSLERMGA